MIIVYLYVHKLVLYIHLMCIMPNAAAQSSSDDISLYRLRQEGEVVELECPLVLGFLHNVIDPYYIFWKEGSDIINSTSHTLSSDNQTLSIPKSGNTPKVFTCYLRLMTCNGCQVGNFGATRFQLDLIGKDTDIPQESI